MINVSIAGIGGQGSVLAARILAQAAEAKGWQVRSAETIGMAQRGGNVISHVRMGNLGETIYSSLPALGSDDVLIALEPGEGVRALPFLKDDGILVLPETGVASAVVNLQNPEYNPALLIKKLKTKNTNLVVVDDETICMRLDSRKSLNIVMLAYALCAIERNPRFEKNALHNNLSLSEIRQAIDVCVKEEFLAMNQKAIDIVEKAYRN